MPLSSSHRPAARKILMGQIYEPLTIDFMMSNCQDGDVVHAGAYFGDFLPALSTGCAGGCKIWAFEPNPENYRCARITLEMNGIENVDLRNAGISSERGELPFRTMDGRGKALGGLSSIVSENSMEGGNSEMVEVLTIDEVIGPERVVSIIQLDIEGHELEALMGALGTIRRCLPILILEELPDSTLLGGVWFDENILSLGYSKIGEFHRNSVFSCSSLSAK